MDFKDWITLIGIPVTAALTAINIWISVKNRRNAMREHLYKEQLTFFLQVTDYIVKLENIFSDIAMENECFDEKSEEMEELMEATYSFVVKHAILVPSEKIGNTLMDTIDIVYDIDALIYKADGKIKLKDIEPLYKASTAMVDTLQHFMRIQALSEENHTITDAKMRWFNRKEKNLGLKDR